MVMDCSHCSIRLDSRVYSLPVSLYRGGCIHILVYFGYNIRTYIRTVRMYTFLFTVLTGASKPSSPLQCSHLSSHCIHVCIYMYMYVHTCTSLFSVMYDCTYVHVHVHTCMYV